MASDDVLKGDFKKIYDNVMNAPTGSTQPPKIDSRKTETQPDPQAPKTEPEPPQNPTPPLPKQESTTPPVTSFAFSGKAANATPVNKVPTTPPTGVTKEATNITKKSSRTPLIIFVVFAGAIVWGVVWAVILGII